MLNVPKYFEQFYPKFEYILVNLAEYTDMQLLSVGKTYLTSTLLLFKHQKDKQFVLSFYKEIFIFVESYKNRDRTERFSKTLILYIFQTFTITEEEFNEIVEDFPKNIADMFVSTYDMAVEKGLIKGEKIGIEKGIAKGREEGREEGKVIHSFSVAFKGFSNKSQASDKFIADLTDLKIPTVRSLRKAYEEKNKKPAFQTMDKILKSGGFISNEYEKQIKLLIKQFFKK